MASNGLPTTGKPSRLSAILRLRCPRCFRGRVFSGLLRMNDVCPYCGLRLGREEGYFTGAMYVSYGLGLALMTAIFVVMWLFSSRTLLAAEVLLLITVALYLPLVPIVYRYSRVLWMHFDRKFDPEE